jgi:hypothetical protein
MEKLCKMGLSELRDRRLSTFRPDFPANIEKSARQRAINKLLESNFKKAGFEFDKIGALIKQSDAAARQRIANLMAEADSQSPAALAALHPTVENWNNRLEHLKTLDTPDAPTQWILLDTATEISATSGIILDSTHIGPAPESNWAKFFYNTSGGGELIVGGEEVSFGFLWQNPSDRYAAVNVNGYIVLNGSFAVWSDGGVFAASYSRLAVDVHLYLHELWNDPPTSPVFQPTQEETALALFCKTFGFFQIGDNDSQNLNRGFLLQYSQFVLPPKGTVMLEVACSLLWDADDGQTYSDFSFRDRRLLCPGVFIGVL